MKGSKKMKNYLFRHGWSLGVALITLSLFIANAEASVSQNKYQIKVLTDRQNALYKCEEKTVFEITVNKNGKLLKTGQVTVKLTNDGYQDISTKLIDLSRGNPFKLSGSLNNPGFIRCEVIFHQGKKKYFGWGGAGFCPEKIKPATKLPDDFRKFWADGQIRLSKIPIDVKMSKMPKFCNDKYDGYKISFSNIDNTRIYGFLSVPKGKGPFPAMITVPGAGPGAKNPESFWASKGVIVLKMNVHAYDPPVESQKLHMVYANLNKKQTYSHHGAPDREKYYYRRAYLGINRSIKWLCSRPDWDQKHLVASGSSQGGGSSIILAGLNNKITAVGANVPALCDHAGYLAGRNPGWPKLVLNNGKKDKFLKMSAYFDTVNFARFVNCPTVICVGFIDRTCSPSSVYSAYNSINAPKKIINKPLMGHEVNKDFYKFLNRWIKGQLGLKTQIPPVSGQYK